MKRDDEVARGGGTLVGSVANALREAILSGEYRIGDKLPSGTQLTEEYGVSRTVIREAVASLQADGLVEARQGSGVFVLEPMKPGSQPFQDIDYKKISTVLELLELRAAVEMEAAALAAQRRSPAQEEQLMLCLRELEACIQSGRPTVDADFALHLAVADATNNHRFGEFLKMMGRNIIPRAALGMGDPEQRSNLERLHKEHAEIVDAILDGDVDRAREAMRVHLVGGRQRYRMLLRQIEKDV